MMRELKDSIGQKDAELQELRNQKEVELQELRNQKEVELQELRNQKEVELQELRNQKDQELVVLRTQQSEELQNQHEQAIADSAIKEQKIEQLLLIQHEIDRHFHGAMQTVTDIKHSLSYRLGMFLTWPIRKVYDLMEGFGKYPGVVSLAVRMGLSIARHPIKSLRLLNWERVRNAYITFFKDPANADRVVAYYDRLLSGGASSISSFSKSLVNPSELFDDAGLYWEDENKVSLIVINYNGCHHLPGLLTSLYSQDYQNFEIILVDNGSSDNSVEYVKENFPSVKLIAMKDNLGFAEGNNVAMEVASGRYYCLLNNDTQVEPSWLSKLVKLMQSSPKAGAIGPKILFWKKFALIELKIRGEKLKKPEGVLDISSLEKSALVYKKWFFASGWSEEEIVDGVKVRRFSGAARLWFPICDGQTAVNLRVQPSENNELSTEIISQAAIASVSKSLPTQEWTELSLEFTDLDHPALQYIINNAASQVNQYGEASDRGFGMPGDGTFDQTEARHGTMWLCHVNTTRSAQRTSYFC